MLQSYVTVKLSSLLQISPESACTSKVLLGIRLKNQLFLQIAPLTVAALFSVISFVLLFTKKIYQA